MRTAKNLDSNIVKQVKITNQMMGVNTMAKLKITEAAKEKMNNNSGPYTLYLACRGG